MYAGGENNIPEGGKKAADLPVCDPSVSSCPDAAPTEAEWSLPSGEGVCEEAQPVSDASAFADELCYPSGNPDGHMTSTQSVFFGEGSMMTENYPVLEEDSSIIPDPAMDPNDILDSVVASLTGPKPTMSAIERVSGWSPFDVFTVDPKITSSAAKNKYDLLGPEIDGKEYAKTADKGMKALQDVWKYMQMTPEELAALSPHEQKKFAKAIKAYEAAAQSIYYEGIAYGWTPSHAMEGYVNSVYQIKAAYEKVAPIEEKIRADLAAKGTDPAKFEGEVARLLEEKCAEKKIHAQYKLYKAHVSGGNVVMGHLNFGIPMTDLNKRDTSGRLGDAVRDYVRELTNEHLGKTDGKSYDAKGAKNGKKAADNVSALKAMTYAVHGVTEAQAAEGLSKIQAELQGAIDSGKFAERLPADMKDIPLAGLRIQLKGYHFESQIKLVDITPEGRATVHSIGLGVLGAMSHGEDVASKVCKKKPTILVTEPLESKGVVKATHAIYGLFRSSSPGTEVTFEPGKAPDKMQVVLETDLTDGVLLRPGHDFGYGLAHAKNIKGMHAELSYAIADYGRARAGTAAKKEALARITVAKKDLGSYMLKPEIEVVGKDGKKRRVAVDPTNTPVLERMASDYAKSRNVYRFRTANGEGFVAFKRDHAGQMISERGKGYKGKQWIVGMELGKVGDYMKKYASHDGIKDPVFAQLFDIISHELGKRGFDVQMCVMGGDEFLFHVRENSGEKHTDAEFTRAVDETIGTFEGKHEARSYTYSEKASVPGGKWTLSHHDNGIQFGVHEGKVYFKKPRGNWMPHKAHAFKKQVGEIMADPKFRAAVAENFPGVDLKKPKIASEKKFSELGEVKRRDVWFVPSKDVTEHGELYLMAGKECKTKGAARPERVLTAEAGVMRVDGAKRLDTAVKDIFDAIADNKKTSTRVKEVKARGAGHVAKSVGREGAIFMAGVMGAKFLTNLGKAIVDDDWDDLTEGIHAGTELEVFGAMTVGGTLAKGTLEAVERYGVARVAPAAVKAFKIKHAGLRGGVLHGGMLMGGLIAAELITTGELDATSVGLGATNVVIAGVITSVAAKTSKVRKAATFLGGPVSAGVKIAAETLIIEGLGYLEGEVMIAMERSERKEALGDALLEYDRAVSAARKVDAASLDPDNPPEEFVRVGTAYNALLEAYGSCMEMEKYYAATEFDPVEEASDDIEDLTVERDEAVSELMEWDGHERVVISPADMSRVSPLSGLEAGMHVPRSRYLAALADKLEADLHKAEENLGSIVRGAEENYKKNAATMAEEADGYEYDVPFSFEGGDEEPEMPTNCTNVGIPGETIEYRYSPAAREEMHTPICDYKEPEKRWHHAMSLNPHKVTVLLHYTLEKASRALAGSGVSARGDI